MNSSRVHFASAVSNYVRFISPGVETKIAGGFTARLSYLHVISLSTLDEMCDRVLEGSQTHAWNGDGNDEIVQLQIRYAGKNQI